MDVRSKQISRRQMLSQAGAGFGMIGLAGALQAHRRGELSAEEAVVCLVTGAGFKDSGALEKLAAQQSCAAVSLRELDERLRR